MNNITPRSIVLSLLLTCFTILSSSAQDYKVGVRAGVDFTTLSGPTEANETFSVSQGFHFGFNVARYFTNQISVRAEFLYQQKGYKKNYQGAGYYGIKDSDNAIKYIPGDLDYILEVSNAYISLPITFHFQPVKQIEVYAGISPNFLINPIGNGNVLFVSSENPDRLFFRQTLAHRYYQDVVGGTGSTTGTTTSSTGPQVYCGDDIITVPSTIGAYYWQDSSDEGERAYKWFDLSAVIGTQIYVNKSFYVGARFEYGLIDTTNDNVDISLGSLHSNGGFQLNEDKDLNIGGQFSVGFRF